MRQAKEESRNKRSKETREKLITLISDRISMV